MDVYKTFSELNKTISNMLPVLEHDVQEAAEIKTQLETEKILTKQQKAIIVNQQRELNFLRNYYHASGMHIAQQSSRIRELQKQLEEKKPKKEDKREVEEKLKESAETNRRLTQVILYLKNREKQLMTELNNLKSDNSETIEDLFF